MSTADLCEILNKCDIEFIEKIPLGITFRFRRCWCIRTGISIFEYEKNGAKYTDAIADYLGHTVAVPLKVTQKEKIVKSKTQGNVEFIDGVPFTEDSGRFDDPY